MGQTSKAQSTYEKALELDPQCSEALEGYRNCSIATHSDPEEVEDLFCGIKCHQNIINLSFH